MGQDHVPTIENLRGELFVLGSVFFAIFPLKKTCGRFFSINKKIKVQGVGRGSKGCLSWQDLRNYDKQVSFATKTRKKRLRKEMIWNDIRCCITWRNHAYITSLHALSTEHLDKTMKDFFWFFHHHHLLFSGQDSGGHSLRMPPKKHSSLQNRQLKSFSFPSRWFHGSFDCFRGPKVGINHTAVDQTKVRWYISCSCAR